MKDTQYATCTLENLHKSCCVRCSAALVNSQPICMSRLPVVILLLNDFGVVLPVLNWRHHNNPEILPPQPQLPIFEPWAPQVFPMI